MNKPTALNAVPQGGFWRYREPDTGVTIEANHWKAFLAKAFRHREANGLYTGSNWEAEIWALVCEQHPEVECGPNGELKADFTLDDIRRFAKFFVEWRQAGGQWVPQEEAEQRAAICKGCKNNVSLLGCWGCKGALNWMAENMGGRSTSQDADLQQCRICKCTNRFAIHAPLEVMDYTDLKEEFPPWCWKVTSPESSPQDAGL